MFQEKRKQGLAFRIERPWGAGREPGLVQIKLMLLMDLVLVEMGAAAEPAGRGRGFLEVELTDAGRLRLEGTLDFGFPEEEGAASPSWVTGLLSPGQGI